MCKRCSWAKTKSLKEYHDNIYGKKIYDTKNLFKSLTLESAQAGLSWQIIWDRQKDYDDFFYNFQIEEILSENECYYLKKLDDSNIIKHKLKCKSVYKNAGIIKKIENEESFYNYLIKNFESDKTKEENIDKLIKRMKKDGFKFIGTEIITSFLSAIGICDGHEKTCEFRDIEYILK